jgi:hypothetical protein
MNGSERGIYYLRGIPVPETPSPGKDPSPWKKTLIVGTRHPRVDAYERVSGTASTHPISIFHGCFMERYFAAPIPTLW